MSFDAAQSVFNQVDTNRDGQIDRTEFNQWLGGVSSGANFGSSSGYDASFSYGGSAGLGATAASDSSASYSAVGAGATSDVSAYETTAVSSDVAVAGANAASFDSSSFNSSTAVQRYATDAQGYFLDSNPLVVRAAAAGCPSLYTRNVRVRYLQPPSLEPHGPLIVRQVRPPQPPPPPPVYLRRVDPRPKTPPPVILRERPPPKPGKNPSRTVTVTVPNPPVPPRSVIRDITLPPPPKPSDIYIERWRQYPPRGPGRRILVPAPPPKSYPAPRNQIIIRQCAAPRIEHKVERLGDLQMNPETYYQQYSASLVDATEINRRIRAIGLPVDIVEQVMSTSSSTSSIGYTQDFSGFGSSASIGAGFGAASTGGASYFESSNFGSSGAAGFDFGAAESSSSSTAFESSSFGVGDGSTGNGVDVVSATFNNADTNQDGTLSRSEFARFFQQGL